MQKQNRFEIINYENVPAEQWDQLVEESTMGYVYHRYAVTAMDEYQENCNCSFAIYDRIDGQILFVMPLFWDEKSKKLISRYGFVVADGLPRHYRMKLEEFYKSHMNMLLKKYGVRSVVSEQPSLCAYNMPNQGQTSINPFYFFGFKPGLRYCWVVDLQKPENAILDECEQTTRQAIRKFAEETAYCFCCVTPEQEAASCEEFIQLSAQTYGRSAKKSKSEDYYRHLFKHIDSSGRKLYCIRSKCDGSMIVGAIIGIHANTAVYSYGASVAEKPVGISKYLFYQIMLDLKKQNIRYFETGGAYSYLPKTEKLRGISDFKKSFGTFLHTIHMGEFFERNG